MDTLKFDTAAGQQLLRTYTTRDVIAQRQAVREALRLQSGESVLDIGSGPGLLAVEMAAEVAPGGTVTGLEPSAEMRALAATVAADAVQSSLSFTDGDATDLPFEDAAFDAVTSTQVYEYVADVPAALREVRRVLRPGGRVLVLDTDWDSIVWRSSDDARMQRVLAAWDDHLVHAHLPRLLPVMLADAGFELETAEIVPLLNIGYRAETYSDGLIGFISAFVPGHRDVSADEVDAWATDLRSLGDDYFCSLNRYLFVAGAR